MGQAVVYESLRKREVLQDEITKMERQSRRMDSEVSAGLIDSASFSHDRIDDKAGFMARLKNKKERLRLITPPSIKELAERGVTEDNLRKRAEQLAKFIVMPHGKFPRMRSRIEMDQCPAGADDMERLYHQKISHHNITRDGEMVKTDHGKSQYPAYAEFKNLCRILGKDSESELDSSLANLELLRPDNVADKDTLMNFRTRTYANPAANLNAQEYEDRVGIDHLNPLQLALHELEKQGKVAPPTMEEHFERMFGPGDHKSENGAAEPDTPAPASIGDPIDIGNNQWMTPDGDTLTGTEQQIMEQWRAQQDTKDTQKDDD